MNIANNKIKKTIKNKSIQILIYGVNLTIKIIPANNPIILPIKIKMATKILLNIFMQKILATFSVTLSKVKGYRVLVLKNNPGLHPKLQ